MHKLTSPLKLDRAFIKHFCDVDPNKCSDLAVYNCAYNAGTAIRCITHFRQICEAKRFQYFDYASTDANQKVYGQDGPPEINLKAFNDFPIAVLGGKEDLMVSRGDYTWLRDQLVERNNCNFFKEYDLGHLGLIIPKDKTIMLDMLALAKKFASDSSKIAVPDSIAFNNA